MASKQLALGRDIKEFWDNGFPEGYYSDDAEIQVEDDAGHCPLDLDVKYDLNRFGVLIPEGNAMAGEQGDPISFASAFKRWFKEQTTVTLLVTVPKEKADEARAKLKELGYIIA